MALDLGRGAQRSPLVVNKHSTSLCGNFEEQGVENMSSEQFITTRQGKTLSSPSGSV
jgi:hypothetical protein